jgi:hypothetical protein
MDQEIKQLLEGVAAQLGTTVEHLWGVMTAQAPIHATTASILAACFIIAAYIVVRFVMSKTMGKNGGGVFWNSEGCFFGWVFSATLIMAACVFGVRAVEAIMTAVFNPEYYALRLLF